jgi:hypothetical protein
LVCQNLSRKKRRIIWIQLAPSPSRRKRDDETRLDPTKFGLGLTEAPMISPTPVEIVARTFCFRILYRCGRENSIVEKNTPIAGGRATKRDAKPVDGAIPGVRFEFWTTYDKVRNVTPNPRADLINPVFKSSAVNSPKAVMLITYDNGVP